MDLDDTIAGLMHEAQMSSACHPKCVSQMKKLLDSNDFETFWTAFQRVFGYILPLNSKQTHRNGERCIDFIALFCTSFERRPSTDEDESFEESTLLTETFNYLLKTQENVDEHVRFRSCQIINKLLSSLVGYDLSWTLSDKVQEAMLQRAMDTKPGIRLQAVTALCPLQDPMNTNCSIIQLYLRLMSNDSNPTVRMLCVNKIALIRDAIPSICNCTRDVNLKVRLAAYNRALKCPLHFKIVERHKLLKNGFNDEFPAVRAFVQQHLVLAWFQHYDENYLKLIKSLRLDSDWKDLETTVTVVEFVIQALIGIKPFMDLLEVLKLDEQKLVPMEDLNWESILYWRILVQQLHKIDEEEMSTYLPDFISFCDFVKRFNNFKKGQRLNDTEYLEYQFTIKEMFLLLNSYDLSESECRRHMNNLISEIIRDSTLDFEVIEVMIKSFDLTFSRVEDRIRHVCELVSEIMYVNEKPDEPQEDSTFEVAKLKVKLNELNEDMHTLIKERDFLKADEIQKEIATVEESLKTHHEKLEKIANRQLQKNTDIPTISKYLDICNCMLKSPKVKELSGMLRTLKEQVIQNLMIHDNETIRHKALKNYTLLCILDQDSAKVGIHVFCASIYAYNSGVPCDVPALLVAISAVVDFIMLFGTDLIATPKAVQNDLHDSFDEQHESVFKGGSSLSALIQGLIDLMQDENPEIQECAGHGLCNLLLAGRVQSPTIVSRLIIKWASLATESSLKLRQLIGSALEQLPMVPDSSNQIEKAVLPTIKTISRAPKKSPLADINMDNIAKFLVALSKSCPDGDFVHMNLARSICTEIIANPKRKCNKVFSKMLLQLTLQENNVHAVRELLVLCDDIRNEVHERQVLGNIVKFNAILTTAANNISTIEEEEEILVNESTDCSGNGESKDGTTVPETTVNEISGSKESSRVDLRVSTNTTTIPDTDEENEKSPNELAINENTKKYLINGRSKGIMVTEETCNETTSSEESNRSELCVSLATTTIPETDEEESDE